MLFFWNACICLQCVKHGLCKQVGSCGNISVSECSAAFGLQPAQGHEEAVILESTQMMLQTATPFDISQVHSGENMLWQSVHGSYGHDDKESELFHTAKAHSSTLPAMAADVEAAQAARDEHIAEGRNKQTFQRIYQASHIIELYKPLDLERVS